MELSQKLEIETMEQWLRERGEEVPTAAEHEREHGPGGTPMPGMATLAQLERLAASRGADFDRRFIRLMERHHEGAVVMVTRLVDEGGAQESQLDGFTRDVLADQEIELGRMEAIRAELPPPSASPGGAAAGSAAWGGKPPALCILT
jgi:uncharacterized protein (DUF305 family)